MCSENGLVTLSLDKLETKKKWKNERNKQMNSFKNVNKREQETFRNVSSSCVHRSTDIR